MQKQKDLGNEKAVRFLPPKETYKEEGGGKNKQRAVHGSPLDPQACLLSVMDMAGNRNAGNECNVRNRPNSIWERRQEPVRDVLELRLRPKGRFRSN